MWRRHKPKFSEAISLKTQQQNATLGFGIGTQILWRDITDFSSFTIDPCSCQEYEMHVPAHQKDLQACTYHGNPKFGLKNGSGGKNRDNSGNIFLGVLEGGKWPPWSDRTAQGSDRAVRESLSLREDKLGDEGDPSLGSDGVQSYRVWMGWAELDGSISIPREGKRCTTSTQRVQSVGHGCRCRVRAGHKATTWIQSPSR